MAIKLGVLGGAVLMAWLALTGPGRAQTISYADAITVLANDCGASCVNGGRLLSLFVRRDFQGVTLRTISRSALLQHITNCDVGAPAGFVAAADAAIRS